MSLKHITYLLLTLTVLMAGSVHTQTASKFWIIVNDNVYHYNDILGFGNDVNATYGVEITLGEYPWLPPPPGPTAWWINLPGHTNTWGAGLFPNDYRSIPTNPTQKDSFRIQFGVEEPDSNIYFSWPDISYLSARCDSMFFRYYDPQIPANVVINMFQQSSLVIPAAGTNGINKAYIFKYGVKIIDDVSRESKTIPANFALRQNYPNPFNPVTQLQFSIANLQFVTLKIYDLFGREVATLVNKQMAPGNYTQEWNAGGVASGVYFYRLQAGDFIDVKKMVLVR